MRKNLLAMPAIAAMLLAATESVAAPRGNLPQDAQTQNRENQNQPQLQSEGTPRAAGEARSATRLARLVRNELVTLPYYDVFDWLEGVAQQDGTVILRGQVTRPTTKSDAEANVKDVEGVSKVVNEIEVLPLSPNDDRLRRALFARIFNGNGPLYKYSFRAVPPIHIIVNRGRVTLKGVVATQLESTYAYTQANSQSGVFEVKNELAVESARPR